MSYGFNIAENLHIVNAIPATPGSAATHTGDYINMENAAHIDWIVSFGTTAATSTIEVLQAMSASGGTATNLAFNYYAEVTDTGDTIEGPTLATASGVITDGILVPATDKIYYVVSVDAAQMAETKKWITLTIKMAGNNAACAVAVLSGLRYKPTVTAIT